MTTHTIFYLHNGAQHRHTTHRSLNAALYHLRLIRHAGFIAWISRTACSINTSSNPAK
jgi:hypothetical protein